MRGQIDTYFDGGSWKNRAEDEPRTLSVHSTREEAVIAGRTAAETRGVVHVVLNEDGTLAERRSYERPAATRDSR